MSYQVLARKYRPKNFAEVVGQKYVVSALCQSLKQDKLHHAYLFAGTRGVGKTSIARLFAKSLNCENKIDGSIACDQCENCQDINNGSFIDLIEIDAASKTKVEDTRELLDNVQYKPVRGRYKIYLIDEVHMLSRSSFNALLKTLEEPPEYVKFLLATTEPQKLPVTILSRCMQLNLQPLSQQDISDHLKHILNNEKISFEDPAIDQIALSAKGSIRDSLSLTDQAIALSYTNENQCISFDLVLNMLGLMHDEDLYKVVESLAYIDAQKLILNVRNITQQGVNPVNILKQIISLFHQIALYQFLPQDNSNEKLSFLATYLSPSEVQFFYGMLANNLKDLENYQTLDNLEMILLRALAFQPEKDEIKPIFTPKVTATATDFRDFSEKTPQNSIKEDKNLENQAEPQIKTKVETKVEDKENKKDVTEKAELKSSDKDLDLLNQSLQKLAQTKQDLINMAKAPEISSTVNAITDTSSQENSFQEGDQQKKNLKNDLKVPATYVETDAQAIEYDNDIQEFPEDYYNNAPNFAYQDYSDSLIQDSAPTVAAKAPKNIQSEPRLNRFDDELKSVSDSLQAQITENAKQQDHWSQLVLDANLELGAFQLAQRCAILTIEKDKYTLILDNNDEHLLYEKYTKDLAKAMQEQYNIQLSIKLLAKAEWGEHKNTLEIREQSLANLKKQAVKNLEQDQILYRLSQLFTTEIDKDSVMPC